MRNNNLLEKMPDITKRLEKEFNDVYTRLAPSELYERLSKLKAERYNNPYLVDAQRDIIERKMRALNTCLSMRLKDMEDYVMNDMRTRIKKAYHKRNDKVLKTWHDKLTILAVDSGHDFIEKYASIEKEQIEKIKDPRNKYYNAKTDKDGVFRFNDYQYGDCFDVEGEMKKFDGEGWLVTEEEDEKKKEKKRKKNKKDHPFLNRLANLLELLKKGFQHFLNIFLPNMEKEARKTTKMMRREARRAVAELTSNNKKDLESAYELEGLSVVKGKKKDKKKSKKKSKKKE